MPAFIVSIDSPAGVPGRDQRPLMIHASDENEARTRGAERMKVSPGKVTVTPYGGDTIGSLFNPS